MKDAPVSDEAMDQNAEPVDPKEESEARRRPRQARRHRRFSLTLVLTLVLLALVVGFFALAFTGKSLRVPTWAVAELEERLNNGLSGTDLPSGTALSVGAVELAVEEDFAPRFRLLDIRLLDGGGRAILRLPEARAAFDPESLLSGQVRLSALRFSGARIAARRDEEGRFDLQLGIMGAGPQNLGEVIRAANALFSSPALSRLRQIDAEGLTLSLNDARAGRSWELGDGRLSISNTGEGIVAELGVTLLDGAQPAQASFRLTANKTDGEARLSATLDQVAAGDIATFAPPLAWLSLVSAPLSGRFDARLSSSGACRGLRQSFGLRLAFCNPVPKGARSPLTRRN